MIEQEATEGTEKFFSKHFVKSCVATVDDFSTLIFLPNSVHEMSPRITICIPHWQVGDYMRACLRSIRKHSRKYDLEVMVVDNGSRDESLDYLRSLSWIRLIERPEETHTNWPLNVFTAWDRGVRESDSEYFVSMHSDVFVKSDDWLDPLIKRMRRSETIGAAGCWKLEDGHPIYLWQKRVVGYLVGHIKKLWGRGNAVEFKQQYPRDFCAMYRADLLRDLDLTFTGVKDYRGGSQSIAMQLVDAGYDLSMIPVEQMASRIYHVAHGTAAVAPEKPLNHARAQKKAERRAQTLFDEPWIRALMEDESLDDAMREAA